MLREKRFQWAAATFERIIRDESRDSAEAAYCLAIMHHTGSGVQKNLDEAEKYYLIARQRGHPMATYRLATIYQQSGELQKAYETYCSAAHNVPSAAYWAYRLLTTNQSLDRDAEAAEKHLNSAAAQGHVMALREIALRNLSGREGLLKIPYGMALMTKAMFNLIQTVVIKNEKMKYE